MAQAKTRNKTTAKAKPRVKAAVRVGGKKVVKKPWYRKWQALGFVVVFGVLGSVLLILTRAASPANCVAASSNGSTLNFCITSSSQFNALLATADYVAANNQSLMTSASLSLQVCSPQTSLCKTVDSSNVLRLYSSAQPRYQRLYTHGITFLLGAHYRVCMSSTTAAGWTVNNSCSQIVNYGNSVNNAPQPVSTTVQTSAAYATTTPASPTTCSETTLKKADGTAWQCTFDDEFNGTAVDSTKWSPILTSSTSFNSAPDCYVNTPNNISVSNGALNLTTRKEAAPFLCQAVQRASYTSQVTSGTISTYQKFSQQYGRFEIRAKVPSSDKPGLQESFWLWPDKVFDQDPGNAPWPSTGEIDIAEMYHAVGDRAIPFIHYNPATTDSNVTNNYCYIDNTQYHTYTLTWTPTTIQVNVDGYTCLIDHPNAKSPEVSPQPFNKTFFLNLTSGLGEGANGNAYQDGVTMLPATTQVDYVRIWK